MTPLVSSSGDAVLASLQKPPVRDAVWLWRLVPAHAVLGAACLYHFREFGGSSFEARFMLASLATGVLAMMPLRAGLRAEHMRSARTFMSCLFYGWLNCLLASAIIIDDYSLGMLLFIAVLGVVFAFPCSAIFGALQATTVALVGRFAPADNGSSSAAALTRPPASSAALWAVSGLYAALSAIAARVTMLLAAPFPRPRPYGLHPRVIHWMIAGLLLWALVQLLMATLHHARRARKIRQFEAGTHAGFRVLTKQQVQERLGAGHPLQHLPRLSLPTPHLVPARVLMRQSAAVGEGAYRQTRVERPVAVF